MRFTILTILGCLISFIPAHATAISKNQANSMYLKCKQNQDPRFSTKTQDLFCACTAAKTMESLSVEDTRQMAQQNQSGRNALNKMIIQVYAPCMQYPTRDYHYNACIKNPKTKILGNPQSLCSCSADKIALHLRDNGQSLFQNILNTNPNIMDPMQALYDDPKFQQFAKSKLLGCVSR